MSGFLCTHTHTHKHTHTHTERRSISTAIKIYDHFHRFFQNYKTLKFQAELAYKSAVTPFNLKNLQGLAKLFAKQRRGMENRGMGGRRGFENLHTSVAQKDSVQVRF